MAINQVTKDCVVRAVASEASGEVVIEKELKTDLKTRIQPEQVTN